MIDGVLITPLRQIHDDRGKVMHMLRNDAPIFSQFGEIYFSCVNYKSIKAWKRHNKMTINCAAIYGMVKFILFDDRLESKTNGCVQEVCLSLDNYCLLTVPPGVWNGFQGIANCTSIVANCATIPHCPSECDNLCFSDKKIPYDWVV